MFRSSFNAGITTINCRSLKAEQPILLRAAQYFSERTNLDDAEQEKRANKTRKEKTARIEFFNFDRSGKRIGEAKALLLKLGCR
mmetsp:Transcript_5916/g.12473  ORF Transcript_5916/g.12473 Transcript_5916/m.12473 type:complete len:84 (-) Transcript_5916:1257-1508(-)